MTDASTMPAPPRPTFPFRPGKMPGRGNMPAAKNALHVFAVLHEAHATGRLSLEHLKPLFLRSTSDLITYRAGWKAGKFWSVGAWAQAVEQGHTNGLVSEHVLSRLLALRTALQLPLDDALRFVWEASFECVVTNEGNRRLPGDKGYPDGPWRRYAEAKVHVIDAQHDGLFFLCDEDREPLRRHGILVSP